MKKVLTLDEQIIAAGQLVFSAKTNLSIAQSNVDFFQDALRRKQFEDMKIVLQQAEARLQALHNEQAANE